MKNISLSLLLISFSLLSIAQSPTLGLIHNSSNATEGYTLFTPEKSNNAYLIDNCGQVINSWTFSENPGLTCYLLENGNLLRAGKDSLEIRDWDNNLIWAYAMTLNNLRQHHDIEPLPNGNILCILGDSYTDIEMIALGRDGAITGTQFRLDKIIEIEPVGNNDANIVWEWKFIDHIIQDTDISKPNYGVVENNPQLLDVNYDNGSNNDWIHANGIDYNASLDQVIISSRQMSEIYIIDHSTTTIEAAGHTGGNSNMGGDFLWRWGNPQIYRAGTSTDRLLYGQHDSKWVDDNFLDAGKISVFNNGGDGTASFSSIHLIAPTITNGEYTKNNGMFLPAAYDWSWNGTILDSTVFEGRKSGTHALSNGNFMITETSKGRVSEITKNGELVWSYISPVGLQVFSQFSTNNSTDIFRGEKYPPTYAGFSGKDLTPQGIIENQNMVSDACISTSISEQTSIFDKLTITNPIENNLIQFNSFLDKVTVEIFDINGKSVKRIENFSGNSFSANLPTSAYLLKLNSTEESRTFKLIIN